MSEFRRRLMMVGSGGEPQPLYAVTKEDNPEVMAVCYAQGWAADENLMTFEEAAAVTDIGTAFNNKGLTHFKEFIYFTGVTALGTNALRNNNSLKSLCIPPNVTVIGNFATYNLPLEYLYLPPNIIDFQGNPNTNFTNNSSSNFELHIDSFEAYCKSTGNSCAGLFSGNTNTFKIYVGKNELSKTVIIPSGVTSLRNNLLARYNNGETLIIPDTVVTIGQGAFESAYIGWTNKIDIGNGVTSIEGSAFANVRKCPTLICRAMTAPTLGTNVFQWWGWNLPGGTTKRLVVPRGSTGYDADQWQTVLQDQRGYVLTYLDEYE